VALAIAACATEIKPIRGFDKPPAGLVLDANPGGTVRIFPLFDLSTDPQTFRPRLNGQDTVSVTSDPVTTYDYVDWQMQGWTGGLDPFLSGIPPGAYVVEVVDSTGQSWGMSASLAIPAGGDPYSSTVQSPAVVFTHFDNQVGSWNIDPATQDADPATDEITVTNLLGEDVVVERCTITGGNRTSCTPVGTLAPQADLGTVETLVAPANADHPALFIHLASDASQSYQRDLVQGGEFQYGSVCQVERILVHGTRSTYLSGPTGPPVFAMSTCFGYASGPQ
jgi:hypothetical protein